MMPVGAKGEEHGPTVTLDAAPQLIGETASRLSYFAGTPVPSFCCVNVTRAVVLDKGATAKSLTVPGVPLGGGGVGDGGGGVGDGGGGVGDGGEATVPFGTLILK